MATPTLLDALNDVRVFRGLFPVETWRPWRAFIAAVYGLPLEGEALDTFRTCTGCQEPPPAPAREVWAICGRRAGKSRIASLLAVWTAVRTDWTKHLAAGEVATVAVIAQDMDAARTCLRYIAGILDAVPMLRRRIVQRRKTSIELEGRVVIEVRAASFKATRSYTYAAVLCDEVAFWSDDSSACPDTEVLHALRPGLATLPGSLLVAISSPYSRRGALWEAYRRYYGQGDGDTLVWKAASRTMNATVPEAVITEALERDESAARAEWFAEFRSDLEAFVSADVLAACTVSSRHELPPRSDMSYCGFVDPSGGSADSFTMAVAHLEGDVAVLDCLRETKPPFSPDSVVQEYAALAKTYRLSLLQSDKYALGWVAESFQRQGIVLEQSAAAKSEIYGSALPLLNAHRAELLDHLRLLAQLAGLERRTARGGRDSIDHGPHQHDDVANAACGALTLAAAQMGAACTPQLARRGDTLDWANPDRDGLPRLPMSMRYPDW